jgi:hypothetical protein
MFLTCHFATEGECCSWRTVGSVFDNLPAASVRFSGLPPTSVGLTWQGTFDCVGEPANIGFGAEFCLNGVPSVYAPQQDRVVTHAKWKTLTKVCDTTPEACAEWDYKTGLKNGLEMGEMQGIGAMPINLFSRNLHDEVDKDEGNCRTADKLTFVNGHRFNIHRNVMSDEDYALLLEYAMGDSNIEDIPEYLQKYEIEREDVLARRQLR